MNLEEFYQGLVAKQQKSLSTLFSTYATQDAAAAFRLAEICHLDMVEKYPDMIVANCDQAPFFALVKQKALQETHRVELWATLLSEAALRSRIVAIWMNDLQPVDEWEKLMSTIPKKEQWFFSDIARESLYTQALTIVNWRRDTEHNKYTLLSHVIQLPPPASFRLEQTGILSLVIITIVLLAISGIFTTTSVLLKWTIVFLIVSQYFYLYRYTLTRMSYVTILNLPLTTLRSNPIFGMIFRSKSYQQPTRLPRTSSALPRTPQSRSALNPRTTPLFMRIIMGKQFQTIYEKIHSIRAEGFSKINTP